MLNRTFGVFFFVSAFLFSGITFAQSADTLMVSKKIGLAVNDIAWHAAPPSLPAGARIAVLEGDPKKAAMFTMRVELPAHAVIRRHTHPRDERVTVISGSLYLGFGARPDLAKDQKFSAGSFYLNPPGLPHLLSTDKEPVVIQITGMGPWEIQYEAQK